MDFEEFCEVGKEGEGDVLNRSSKPLLFISRNNFAFIATTMVLTLINTAPIAGLNIKPGYNIPAASGIAMIL